MKISTRLFIGFGSLAACLLVLSVLSVHNVAQLKRSVDSITQDHYRKVEAASSLERHVRNISYSIRNYLLTNSEEIKTAELYRQNQEIESAMLAFYEVERLSADPQTALIVSELERAGEAYLEFQDRVLAVAQSGNTDEAIRQLTEEGVPYQQAVDQAVENLNELTRLTLIQAEQSANSVYENSYRVLLSVAALIVLLGSLVTLWFSRSIVNNLQKVSRVMEEFASGRMDTATRVRGIKADEIGVVAASFNRMADELNERFVKEQSWLKRNEEQLWLHSELSRINGALQTAGSVEELSDSLLRELYQLFAVSCAVLYVSDDEENRFELTGSYAVPSQLKAQLPAVLTAEDSVAGQAVVSGSMQKISGIESRHLRVTSVFYDHAPKAIYIYPLHTNTSDVVAILEMAVHKELTEIEEQLVRQTGDLAGTLLNKTKNKRRLNLLLQQSQSMTERLQQYTEELHAQQEELQQTNAELEEQTAALQESEKMLQAQQSQLEEMNVELEEKAHEMEASQRELEHQAEQLIAASSYKSEFLANMSHELRTPLNSMMILAKLLAENKDGNLTEKQMEFAQTVYSSGNDLLNLIDQILDLSRIESGKVQVNQEPIAIRQLTAFAKKNFEPIAQQKDIDFTIESDPDVPQMIKSDPLRIQQILRNLLSNAFKFTEKGRVTFSVQRDGEKLKMAVTDTGIGIPHEKQDAVFEAFVQADGTTSRKYGGTGLGLSICRQLSQLLGGEITLESETGKGSTFSLFLPLIEAEEELLQEEEQLMLPVKPHQPHQPLQPNENPKRPEREAAFPGRTVLIVDDDIRNVFALSSRLETYGIEVVYAETGLGAIRTLLEHPRIDLVLMDVMMPEMDGDEAIRQIRANPRFEHLPIITVTAKAMPGDREISLEAGASDYITKPVQPDQLLALLNIWLNSKT